MAKKAPKNKKTKPAGITIPQLKQEIKFKERKFKFSDKQQDLLKILLNEQTKISFIAGPAGTSKTFMAVYAALNLISNNDKEIIYIRTIAESGEKSLGALPGTVSDKFAPYLIPLEDKVHEIIESTDAHRLKDDGRLTAIPVNFLRGSTFTDKIIIADEVQNFTAKEITTLLTRIGEGTKIFLCGDFMQSDIKVKNGFLDFFELFTGEDCMEKGIYTFEFSEEDIKRSEILKFVVKKINNINLRYRIKDEQRSVKNVSVE
jgi:phosphate starvation-inducible PhoH-like protein